MDENIARNKKEKKFDNIEDFVKANLHYLPKEKQKDFYNVVHKNNYERVYKNKSDNYELDRYPLGVLKEALNILETQKS